MPKISTLPSTSTLTGAEEIALVQDGVTKRAAVSNVIGTSPALLAAFAAALLTTEADDPITTEDGNFVLIDS